MPGALRRTFHELAMQSFRVETPSPLLAFLVAALGNRSRAKQYLKLRRVSVNGHAAERHDQPLQPGDLLRIGPPQLRSDGIRGISMVYEDEELLVIDKPAGLLTIATDTERTRTAYHRVREHVKQNSPAPDGRIFIVHRLDRETSGLLVLAKTEGAKLQLQSAWGEVEKRYFAIVEGVPAERSGTIESHLTETSVFRVFSGRATSRSKHAVTRYRVLEATGARSLLEVSTLTGRKHQIRVHLADLGHAIVGDDRYGKGRNPGRLALHASFLELPHPTSGETLEFRSPLPAPLRRMLLETNTRRPRPIEQDATQEE